MGGTTELYKIAIQEDINTIGFVPGNRQTNEMCKLAVQHDGLLLKYIHKNNKTYEICKLAVQQNVNAFIYVPKNKQTDELKKLCKSPFQNHETNNNTDNKYMLLTLSIVTVICICMAIK